MNLSTQLQNNEQRTQLSSAGTLLRTMPGGNVLPSGNHVIGAIPTNSIVTGFQAVATGWDGDIVVNIGYDGNSTGFLNNVTLVDGVGAVNDPLSALQAYFGFGGTNITAEIISGNVGTEGELVFIASYTEIETTAGKYTS